MSRSFAAIILAAGQGTRMKSARPKVLFEVAGRPMISYPIDAALQAGAEKVVVVVGHAREEVEAALSARFDARVTSAVQAEQRGTGDAVRAALPALEGFEGDIVILMGDVPLIEREAIEALIATRAEAEGPLALLTSIAEDPKGYGRILRGPEGEILAIREQKDANDEERAIREVNPGVYAMDAAFARNALAALSPDNAQGELYLTDVVAAASAIGGARGITWSLESLRGVNDRAQLAEAESAMRRRIALRHARAGVSIRDLDAVYIDADVEIEADATLEPGVVISGRSTIGAGARVDVGAVLRRVTVAGGAWVRPYTVAEDASIGEGAKVGPFSHLRPGSRLGPEAHVGNFVETKNTSMGQGAKANHLAYLGDGVIEAGVNVGAGTIFCNYDGFQKHVTHLEEGCFIGSDSQLVAPVRVGRGAYVATGTTVTKDVPADALAVARTRQENKEGYAPRLRARLEAQAKRAKAEKKG